MGIYASPREGGNSDILLNALLEGARESGGETLSMATRDLGVSPCLECGACDDTGQCVIDDDMDRVYAEFSAADVVVLSTPVFFYSLPSQAKAVVDRSQAMWAERLLKKQGSALKNYDSGEGYLLAVGATKGKNLFEGLELTAKYFYDALDMEYKGGLFYRQVEKQGAITGHPMALKEAFNLGGKIVKGA